MIKVAKLVLIRKMENADIIKSLSNQVPGFFREVLIFISGFIFLLPIIYIYRDVDVLRYFNSINFGRVEFDFSFILISYFLGRLLFVASGLLESFVVFLRNKARKYENKNGRKNIFLRFLSIFSSRRDDSYLEDRVSDIELCDYQKENYIIHEIIERSVYALYIIRLCVSMALIYSILISWKFIFGFIFLLVLFEIKQWEYLVLLKKIKFQMKLANDKK